MELSERKQKILVAIIEKYIANGEPVGSKTLCDAFGNSVSSATLRNDMADLVSLGFLEQPHASAGRIPSQKGYRYYVDKLMSRRELPEEEQKAIRARLSYRSGDPEQLLEDASSLLAQMTKCVAIATTLADDRETVSKVELLPIGRSTVILVAITSSGLIKNRVCRVDCEASQKLVDEFITLANEHFIGMSISDISTAKIQTIAASVGAKAITMYPLIITLAEMLREISETDVLLEGQSNIFGVVNTPNAHRLLEFLSGRSGIKSMISENKSDLSVVIGRENPHRELQDSSVIIARYKIDGSDAGALGIIGSTRIDYANLIPHIEYLTRLVGSMLSDVLE